MYQTGSRREVRGRLAAIGHRKHVTNAVVQILRHGCIAEITRADRTDGQLLDLFVRQRDEEAFALLVKRHGPLVMGVCKRVLRNNADADDAFQAAFLVLARKAATIGTRELLAQWLHGVAFNTARKLRRTNARRLTRELPLEELLEPCAQEVSDIQCELLAALDEELRRLPDRYRLPIVLCDLQGTTRKETARMLGWHEGTVAGRLARARMLLAARLKNRGLAPISAVVGAILSEQVAVAVPPELIDGVARAASVPGASNAMAMSLVSSRVANTTEGVLTAMFLQKLKTAAMILLLCGLAIAGATGLFRAAATARTEPIIPLVDVGDDKPEPKKPTPTTPSKKIVTLIVVNSTDTEETAKKLMKLFPQSVTVTPVRGEENVLLVYATEAGTKDVVSWLQATAGARPKVIAQMNVENSDKKPAEPKKFVFKMQNVPWDDVLKWYGETTGLGAIYTVKPEGKLTFSPPLGRQYTIGEITDLLNEALQAQKLFVIRGFKSFTLVGTDEKMPLNLIPHIEVNDLSNWGKTEIVEVDIFTSEKLASELKNIASEIKNKLLSPFGRIVLANGNRLTVSDTAGNLKRIVDLLQQIDKPAAGEQIVPVPKAKTISFKMQNAPWSEVVDWYSRESGLKAEHAAKPEGRFTFIPPEGKQYTLLEITDIINRGLMQQHHLLVRKPNSFIVIPADEKIDPTLATRVKLDELKDRGNTELIEVIIPLPPGVKASEKIAELHSQGSVSEFGSVSHITAGAGKSSLVVIDIAESVRKVVRSITSSEQEKPSKEELQETDLLNQADEQIRNRDFAAAEPLLRRQLNSYPTGSEASMAKLFLGICLLQISSAPPQNGSILAKAKAQQEEALRLFRAISSEMDAKLKKDAKLSDHDSWLRTQAAIRVLRAHLAMKNYDDVLSESNDLRQLHRGTIEELIILALIYKTFEQKGDIVKKLQIRDKMKELFDSLPVDKFNSSATEYSREYWEKTWFGEK
jgi:RNA polymerase sigma factor (sigma-70 family)